MHSHINPTRCTQLWSIVSYGVTQNQSNCSVRMLLLISVFWLPNRPAHQKQRRGRLLFTFDSFCDGKIAEPYRLRLLSSNRLTNDVLIGLRKLPERMVPLLHCCNKFWMITIVSFRRRIPELACKISCLSIAEIDCIPFEETSRKRHNPALLPFEMHNFLRFYCYFDITCFQQTGCFMRRHSTRQHFLQSCTTLYVQYFSESPVYFGSLVAHQIFYNCLHETLSRSLH